MNGKNNLIMRMPGLHNNDINNDENRQKRRKTIFKPK